jgi:hypothetical protein
LVALLVGDDDLLHERMPDHVRVRERAEGDTGDPLQQIAGLAKPAARALRQVGLRDVPRHRHLRAVAEAGEEHAHLLAGGVLRLVEDDEGVVQRAAAHERERRDLDLPAFFQLLGPLVLEHVVERVVQRAKVGVHLLGQVTRQKPELLAGLDRGAHQHDAFDALLDQHRRRHCHRQVRLAGSGRTDAEREVVSAHRLDVAALPVGLGQHRLLSSRDQDRLVEQLGQAAIRIRAQPTQRPGDVVRCHVETTPDELHGVGQESKGQPDVFFVTREIDRVAAQADVRPAFLRDLGEQRRLRTCERHEHGGAVDLQVGGVRCVTHEV